MSLRTLLLCVATSILLLRIETVSEAVANALKICAGSIVPSLFVFLVMSEILVVSLLSEKSRAISPKWTAFILGSVCGFPVGAAVCERFYQKGELSNSDVAKIVPFCNNTSPAYVIGAIGASMLGDKRLGILLFSAEIISGILLVLPVKCKGKNNGMSIPDFSLNKVFFKAIEKTTASVLKICAIICFFSAVLSVINQYMGRKIFIISSIILELSNGAANLSAFYAENSTFTVAVLGFLCGWSGVCVHFQIISVLKSVKVKYFGIAKGKAIQGVLTSLVATVGYKLLFCY